jgi:WD40 repeat protein/serine/threonine protein kinase
VSTLNSCARCGAALRPHKAQGLCTRCLLESGLGPPLNCSGAELAAASQKADPAGDSGSSFPRKETVRYFGDYELFEEIARGGMGVVYRARQSSLERIVALKLILAGQFASKQVIQRFRGEVTAAALLQHPNIVAIHDVGIHDGQHYFSMDFVQGKSLSQLVGNRPLPVVRAARYVKIIAEAIHFAHEQGILHRDLKPSNVLVDASDQPRITDFGLAKRFGGPASEGRPPGPPEAGTPYLESFTLTGQMLGSPNFMPPEQADSQRGKVGRPSDVYGLGAILYHLLTARPPFTGETISETLRLVIDSEPVSPRLLNPSVPRDLETLCLKCLEKEPAKRYATAQALADELSRFLRHEPIEARPVSGLENAWRWCRRKPGIASLGAATIVLLLAVVIGAPIAFFRINRERQRAEENLYAADMHSAGAALDDGDLGRAKELLDAHQPRAGQHDLRGFEWRLFRERCRGDDLFALRGYSNSPSTLRFSPDGDTLATRSRDNQLKVWDLTSRTERFTITNVTAISAFTSDGLHFACGTGNGSVRLVEAKTGRTLHALENVGELVALFPDGKTVATTAGGFIVKLLDFTSGNEKFVLPGKGGLDLWGPEFGVGVVITRDGKRLAISNGLGKGVTLWDLVNREILCGSLDQRWSEDHTPIPIPLTFLELSPDGKVLATGGFDGLVKIWDMATGAEVLPHLQAHFDPVVSAAFSPDGKGLATASLDQTIKIWEVATWRETDTLRGHESGVWTVAYSANGSRLASGGQDNTVRVWNTGLKPRRPALFGLSEGESITWSPDSKVLAAHCQDDSIKLWDAATLETKRVIVGASRVVTFSDHGETIVVEFGEGTNKCCDVATGKLMLAGAVVSSGERSSGIRSPGKGSAPIAEDTPITQLWDIAAGKIDFGTGHTQAVTAVTLSPDHHMMISGSVEGTMAFWDVARRQCLASMAAHSGRIVSLAVAPDGTIAASGSTDCTLKLWNLKTRSCLATLNGHKRPIMALAFSPDSKTLASGSADHSIRLWNVSLRCEVAVLRRFIKTNPGVSEEIGSLNFSPDGNALAAVTGGGELLLFRAAPMDEGASRTNAAYRTP